MLLLLRIYLLLTLISLSSFSAADNYRPPFWQLEKGESRIHLLGSIHLGKPEMYPLPAQIEQAFQRSQTLFVEANIDPSNLQGMAGPLLAQGMYQGEDNLSQKLGQKDWQTLSKTVSNLGLPDMLFAQQKPWLASMTLTLLAMQAHGFDPQLGIDLHFLQRANGKKKIVELESLNQQTQLLSSLSETTQLAMLRDTLRVVSQPSYFQQMLDSWKYGKTAQLQAMIDESFRTPPPELEQQLLTQRNQEMSQKLLQHTQQKGDYFVVVGAAHMPGEQGLIKLLQQQGYQLKQP